MSGLGSGERGLRWGRLGSTDLRPLGIGVDIDPRKGVLVRAVGYLDCILIVVCFECLARRLGADSHKEIGID